MDNQQLLNSATKVIIRDFNIDDEKTDLQPTQNIDLSRLKEVLTKEISYLIDHDLGKLKWILYRIDVDEAMLQEILSQTAPEQVASVIADKIIARQIEKAKTRELYRQGKL